MEIRHNDMSNADYGINYRRMAVSYQNTHKQDRYWRQKQQNNI